MTIVTLLTQHNQEIAQWSPDPFPRERVGSEHETRILRNNDFTREMGGREGRGSKIRSSYTITQTQYIP